MILGNALDQTLATEISLDDSLRARGMKGEGFVSLDHEYILAH